MSKDKLVVTTAFYQYVKLHPAWHTSENTNLYPLLCCNITQYAALSVCFMGRDLFMNEFPFLCVPVSEIYM